jgi:prepilin-type N-terminal cleavage/methylation domain-containing protein
LSDGVGGAEFGVTAGRSRLNSDSGFRSANSTCIRGFSLVELVVVLFLIGIMLSFTLPRFHDTILTNHTQSVSRRIIATVQSLKERSVRDQKLYILHVNLDTRRLWVTHEPMSVEERENAKQKGYALPDDVVLLDVETPGKGKIASGQADIHFYKKGYSDRALIHIEDDDHQRSFLIETFLSRVRLYEKYVEFEG